MKRSYKNHVALRVAHRLSSRARELRRELRDHHRNEFSRILAAEKRARGLRLYVAWSRPPQNRPAILAAGDGFALETACSPRVLNAA